MKRVNVKFWIAAFCICSAALSNKTMAQTIASGNCGASGNNLMWTLTKSGNDTVLTISGSGNMADYDGTNMPWYSSISAIKTIIIGSNVTSIGNYAFRGCYRITSVTIPNSVTRIGGSTFMYCDGLTSVTIPNSVTDIGQEAFFYCGLTSLTIGNSVTSIGAWAFYGCSSLQTVNFNAINCSMSYYVIGGMPSSPFARCSPFTLNIGDNVKYIHFVFVDSLKSVTISDSVIDIGEQAFSFCSSLTSIIIGNNVKNIGKHAFFNCSSLTSITIPNSVKTIGDSAFLGCSSLSYITSNAVTPPALGSNAFLGVTPTIPVYVPCSSLADYQRDWSYFSNFIGLNDTTIVFDTICYATTYNDNGFNIPAASGVYYLANGCHITCLNLTVYQQVPITPFSDIICKGTSYSDDNFKNITQAGVHYDTLKNVNDCDSIIELTLEYYPIVPITTYSDTLCFGESYDFGGKTYTVAGTYYDTLHNINGCDSIIGLVLDFYPNVPITNYPASISYGEIYNDANFKDLTQAGTYCDTLENVNGCDSVVCLTLTVNTNGIVGANGIRPEIRVYPNPTTGQLTIEMMSDNRISDIRLFDVMGRSISIGKSEIGQSHIGQSEIGKSETTIDISHLASGIYYLKIDNQMIKFVKE